ncbi:PREDICTED: uncharacterized protein LOC104596265 [Nelumbo nucifera]|uniref:Uncharacterized protein LOC104596265 n=1 Tax=Nelumbo nucifera TaxID=4432 RepID=A0A1U7ZU39_NELNU|nr:PREDICTED: uncharacterized protein LOC104596265 [Nelumbo nucifera]
MGCPAAAWTNPKPTGGGSSLAANKEPLGMAPYPAASPERKPQTSTNSRLASSVGSNSGTPPIKHLSRAEMAERRVVFKTRIYHYNVDAKGNLSLGILKDG